MVWDRKYVDCAVTSEGEEHIKRTEAAACQLSVATVFVSPLLRALQTCHGLFHRHPNKPKFMVLPYITEVVSDAGDISLGNFAHQALYPDYDWSLLSDLDAKYWFNSVSDNAALHTVVQQARNTDEVIDGLCREIQRVYPVHFEAQSEVLRRAKMAKKYIESEIGTGRNVAVVGHRDMLRALMRLYLPAGQEFLLQNCQIYALPRYP